MALNIPGLLGRIAELPGVINQGLLGPLPVNPQLEQMIGPAQVAAQRQQTQNEFAMSLLAGGSDPRTLQAASQGARQGFGGRIFDLLKEQEAGRLMSAQQAELERQGRFAQDPSGANLPRELQEELVAKRIAAETVPIDPNITAREESELRIREQQHEYDMALQMQRDAADMRVAEMKAAAEAQGGLTPVQQTRALQSLRKEYEGQESVKGMEAVMPMITSARKAPDTGYGDLDMIYAVGKIMDPASVVREGELHLTIAAGSPIQRALGTTRFSIEQGGRLTPKQRKQLLEMLDGRVSAIEQGYERDYSRYSQYARELGFEPEQVVGTRVRGAFAGGGPAGTPKTIASDAEYKSLPSGAVFIGPDGKKRRKP